MRGQKWPNNDPSSRKVWYEKTLKRHISETNADKFVPFSLFAILINSPHGPYHVEFVQDTFIFDEKFALFE